MHNASSFDFFRLTKAKDVVDVSPNTLRKYNRRGLPFYSIKGDRCVYVSRSELAQFIRGDGQPVNPSAGSNLSTPEDLA